ncbi:MAG: hypothetical protein P4L46_24650 [Fimbriimonas sp.]|nr:hypothetical protein [Fimbriimonas sp.]
MCLRGLRIASVIAIYFGGLLPLYGQGKPVYSDLHNFGWTVTNANGTSGPDGTYPYMGAVTFDSAGNMYGTCLKGGPNELPSTLYAGMVWEITADGAYLDLHDFGGTVTNADGTQGPDGTFPSSPVAIDADGNLYGTTEEGGSHDFGIVWKIAKGGTFSDLHDFGGTVINADGSSGPDGGNPQSGCVVDPSGNLVGSARIGSPNGHGMVWKLTKTGHYSDLHDFGGTITDAAGDSSPDGLDPIGGVATDAEGAIYGTAYDGGPQNHGLLWKITPKGAYVDLHDFGKSVTNANGTQGPDGGYPQAAVVFDTVGNLYGVATDGGPSIGGVLWELTKSGHYLDLHDFGANITYSDGSTGPDGYWPEGTIAVDSAGNVYGTTVEGGPSSSNVGILWKCTSNGQYIDLHDFGTFIDIGGGNTGADGTYPFTGVTLDSSGALYGATPAGGHGAGGLVWRYGVPAVALQSLSIAPLSVIGGGMATGTITLSGSAPTGNTVVSLASSDTSASCASSVTVVAGSATATFTIGTAGVTSSKSVTFTAMLGSNTKIATLTIQAASLQSVSVNPPSIGGGGTATGTVTLSGLAGPNGTSLALSSGSAAATVPQTVLVPTSINTATFAITTQPVVSSTNAVIAGSLNAVSQAATLTILPATLAVVTLNPSSVAGGNPSTGTVGLSAEAATGGLTVSLSSSDKTVTVPKSVIVAAGKSHANFTVATKVVTAPKSVTITAMVGPSTKSAALSVVLPAISSLSVNPTTVAGGSASTGTIALTGMAPPAGFSVKLTSNTKAVVVPAAVKVASGKSMATFVIKTTAVAAQIVGTITGVNGTPSQMATMTVNPPRLKSLTLKPASVKSGKTSSGTVTIASVAPTGGCLITLSSNSPAATTPATVMIPAGKTSAVFTVKTAKVGSQTAATIAASYGGTTASAVLTIT